MAPRAEGTKIRFRLEIALTRLQLAELLLDEADKLTADSLRAEALGTRH